MHLEHGSGHASDASAHQSAHNASSARTTQHVGGESSRPLLLGILVALGVSNDIGKVQSQRNGHDQEPLELEGQDAEDAKDNPHSRGGIQSGPKEAGVHRVEWPAWLLGRTLKGKLLRQYRSLEMMLLVSE